MTQWALNDPQLGQQALAQAWLEPATHWPNLTRITQDFSAPVGVLHAPALLHNAQHLRRRAVQAAGSRTAPAIRVGSKSIRCREVMEQLLTLEGYAGVFGFTLAEALHLYRHGFQDVVVGYPTADRNALQELFATEGAAQAITVVIDDPSQLDLIDSVARAPQRPEIRVCLDMDLSLDLPKPLPRIGVWRSPLHHPQQVVDLARHIAARPGFTVVGLLGYEAQIAGVGDNPPSKARGVTVRRLQRLSAKDVAQRRGETVAALSHVVDLEFVNGGGSGSVETTAAEECVTEIAAGSALTGPHLFDSYTAFHPAPATAFALDVVRVPSADRATVLGGGWIASGPPGLDRQPRIVWPEGATYETLEGAGEVQTPLRSNGLHIGQRVWFRHAKGGEPAEHFNNYAVVDDHKVLGMAPTYRGEGEAFL